MNDRELELLINRINRVSIEVNEELRNLREIQASRSSARDTNQTPATPSEPRRNQRPKVGDDIVVTQGRSQGTKGRIIRETPTQFIISSEFVEGTFRKWKNNVKKVEDQEHEQQHT